MNASTWRIAAFLTACMGVSACSYEDCPHDVSVADRSGLPTFCEEFLNTVITVHASGQSHTAELFHCYPDEGLFLRHESGDVVFIRNEVVSHVTFHEDDIPGMTE